MTVRPSPGAAGAPEIEAGVPLPETLAERRAGLVALTFAAFVTGGLAGLVGSLFRLALESAARLRFSFVAWCHRAPSWGWLAPVAVVAIACGLARWLVRRLASDASGSGIPQVKGLVRVAGPFHTPLVLPVKFFGGLLAIGAGLALGREGPSVQMGSAAGELTGKFLRIPRSDRRVLAAAGAGAGLAAAFSAPLGGAVFVIEELARRVHIRIVIASFAASGVAIAVLYQMLGSGPDLDVPPVRPAGPWHLGLNLLFGTLVGLLGVGYNRLVLGMLAGAQQLRGIPSELRAAAIGATVAILGWFAPGFVGGGEELLQTLLHGGLATRLVLAALAVRFFLGPLSYAALTPGGLFAPLLLVGALLGRLYATAVHGLAPGAVPDTASFEVVGMAAFFAATVRAPITGAVLIVEMTGVTSLFVPMLIAVSSAVLVPTLLRDEPIYDALRVRQPGRGP